MCELILSRSCGQVLRSRSLVLSATIKLIYYLLRAFITAYELLRGVHVFVISAYSTGTNRLVSNSISGEMEKTKTMDYNLVSFIY